MLLGESQSRALLTASPENAGALLALLAEVGVPAQRIGTVGGEKLSVEIGGPSPRQFAWEVAALHAAWDGALEKYLG